MVETPPLFDSAHLRTRKKDQLPKESVAGWSTGSKTWQWAMDWLAGSMPITSSQDTQSKRNKTFHHSQMTSLYPSKDHMMSTKNMETWVNWQWHTSETMEIRVLQQWMPNRSIEVMQLQHHCQNPAILNKVHPKASVWADPQIEVPAFINHSQGHCVLLKGQVLDTRGFGNVQGLLCMVR